LSFDPPREPDIPDSDEVVEWPIDGTLDLHLFDPGDIGDLVPDYLNACRERGLLSVRIVHGKGIGELRRTVETLLARLPEVVAAYRPADEAAGGWGAMLVTLHPLTGPPDR
jgi:DNA-nicking Smr family endonuclease